MADALRQSTDRIVTRHQGLVGRAALVSGLTLVSRVLGFVREAVMASVFGDGSAISDAFFTAWRVPNLFRRLFGEGALSTSLQAEMTAADAKGGDAAGARLFLSTLRTASLLLFVVTASVMGAIALFPDAMPGTGWSWLGTDPEPVRDLAVRLMPYVVLVCLTALAGGALNVRGHYFVTSLAPAVMNVGWIATLLFVGWSFADDEGVAREALVTRQWDMARMLAIGVLLSGVLQLALHVPTLARIGLLRPSDGGAAPGETSAWQVLRTAAPLALGAAVYQINVMIDGLMAESLLTDGGPTALYYANRVQQFPLALVATAAIASVFPKLKAHGHLRELGPLRELHDRSQLAVLFLSLPAAAGLIALATPLADVLFGHGNFGPAGVERVGEALAMLAVALVPAGAVGLMGRTYIALGDARTPVVVSSWMVLLNVLLNLAFVRGLGLDVAGFGLATACTSWGNLLWLAVGLRRRLGLPVGLPALPERALRILFAAAVTGGLARLVQLQLVEPVGTLGAVVGAIVAGVAGFVAVAQALELPELAAIRQRLRR